MPKMPSQCSPPDTWNLGPFWKCFLGYYAEFKWQKHLGLWVQMALERVRTPSVTSHGLHVQGLWAAHRVVLLAEQDRMHQGLIKC